jgi:hypothetical protein
MEAIVTMCPFFAFSIPGRNSLIRMKWEAMLTLKILSVNLAELSMMLVPLAKWFR